MSFINHTVQQCANVYHQTLDAETAKGTPIQEAEQKARQDFFRAMPGLENQDSIRAHVACVSYAMLFEMIDQKKASKLLYSAQIASGALRRQSEFSRPDGDPPLPHPFTPLPPHTEAESSKLN
jgi:hypothetical protein